MKFEFSWPYDFQFQAVKYSKGVITFPDIFSKTQAEAWMENFIERNNHYPEKRVDRTFNNVGSKGLEVTDSEWELAAKQMPNPGNFDKSQIRIFEERLSHNLPDHDGERFSAGILETFKDTIVGRPKLAAHEKWTLNAGLGRIYQAWIDQVSIDDAVNMMTPQPDRNYRKIIEMVNEIDGGIKFLYTKFYLPNLDDADKKMNAMIDMGVYKGVSIGFMAPERFAYKKNDVVMWMEWANTREMTGMALESSLVWYGAQGPGATVAKSFGGFTEITQQKGVKMITFQNETLKVKLDIPDQENAGHIGLLSEMIEFGAKRLADEKNQAQAQVAEAQKYQVMVKSVFGRDMAEKDLREIKVAVESGKAFMVEQAVKFGVLAKAFEQKDADAKRTELNGKTLAEVQAVYDGWEKESKKYLAAPQVPQTPAAGVENEVKTNMPIPDKGAVRGHMY